MIIRVLLGLLAIQSRGLLARIFGFVCKVLGAIVRFFTSVFWSLGLLMSAAPKSIIEDLTKGRVTAVVVMMSGVTTDGG